MFPPLSSLLVQHGRQVTAAVQDAIDAAGGWLAFDDFLRIVLYAPGLGYYSAGSEKFGAAGDFVTAPELSPLFAQCVARQCAQVLTQTGGDLLELGAGSGALAEGLLCALQQAGPLPEHYYILEVSAELRARQQQRLANLPLALRRRIEWLETLPATPLHGVLLANEVVDALPFKRFRVKSGAICERGIARGAHETLVEADRPANAILRAEVVRVMGSQLVACAAHDYQSELCLLLDPWVASLSGSLVRGAMLLIDYGLSRHEYYHPQRAQGTLRCHFRHRAHDDALLHPGLQDITAWVDFTRVAEAASAAGLLVSGYCTQAAFLLATGIEQALGAVTGPLERARQAGHARTLLLPGEMGESFKVMALTRGLDAPLCGFAYQDLRASL